MKIGKATLAGIPVLVILGLIYWIGNILKTIWAPLMRHFPPMPGICQWLLGFVFSLIVITLTGYGVELLHPIKLIAKRTAFYKKFVANGKYKVVRIRIYQGTEELGVLEEVIQDPTNKEPAKYKVIVPTAPIPISGQIFLVERKNLAYTDLTTIEFFNQLTSAGLTAIGEKIFNLLKA